MADPRYVNSLRKAGIYYVPIHTPANGPLRKGFWLLSGTSFLGETWAATVGIEPGDAAGILTIGLTNTSHERITWGEAIERGLVMSTPLSLGVDDFVYVHGMAVLGSQSAIENLPSDPPENGQLGDNAKFYWQGRRVSTGEVFFAGEFITVAGIG